MTVYKIFGRNLPAGSLNPDGYHVYDAEGRELVHMVEPVPPYDQPGNDELVWLIPEIGPNQKLTFRITNTPDRSSKRGAIDLVNSPHNLLPNGGFEKVGEGNTAAGWEGDGELDSEVRRSGGYSLRLRGTKRREGRLATKIWLRRGAPYYFGAWGKTHGVSRHGICTSEGAQVLLSGFDSGFDKGERHSATPMAQCYNRDWAKLNFHIESYTDWGLPDLYARASADSAQLQLVLDQRVQFVRSPYQAGTW